MCVIWNASTFGKQDEKDCPSKKVTPIVQESELRHIPIDARKCYFADEYWFKTSPSAFIIQQWGWDCNFTLVPSPIIKKYSPEACWFECHLQAAMEQSYCMPWYFSDLQGECPMMHELGHVAISIS